MHIHKSIFLIYNQNHQLITVVIAMSFFFFLIFVSCNHIWKVESIGRKKNYLSVTINYRDAPLIFMAIMKGHANDSDDEYNYLGSF